MRHLLFAFAVFLNPAIADEPQPEIDTGRSAIKSATAGTYMAVTANPYASRAAEQILARGGTAVDAAIAAQMVLGLVEPQSSGIGGGAFMLSYNAEQKKLRYYDGRETAPAAVNEHYFMHDGKPRSFMQAVIGGYSVGVPGVISMLALAHRHDGKLPWASLFQPAIQLAESGFEVSPRLHQLLLKLPRVAARPAITHYFFNSDGEPLPVGYRLKNPEYAQTLRTIAKGGADAFYRGEIAEAIVQAVQDDPINPGLLSLEDMAKYHAKERQPLCFPFLQYRVCSADAPSSGGATMGGILGVLQAFPLQDLEAGGDQLTHLFVEASELAFADRNTYAADPDFVSVPSTLLVSTHYLKRRAALIDPDSATVAKPGNPTGQPSKRGMSQSPEMPNTSHLVIVDRYGDGVSMTTSIETGFGSRLFVKGFLLNNQLTDFSFTPKNTDGLSVANRIQARKRPRSSMSPTIVFNPDGSMRLLVGSPGGSRIIDYTARTILYHLGLNMPIADAIAAGNIAAIGRRVELEPGFFSEDTVEKLQARGHRVVERNLNSGLHAIALKDNKLYGGADPRREGSAQGH
ncbi:gamma-glutamyltransferase [Microbulbifer sp. 2205BS26-8]|uniref:gamma-glutamyltransferase n=1 Tax=Microbulbifer sp. 2205BS26-8 TaxID=3064386 RepID=UPI00273E708B|nr:gamma-glutamyltransferase [Microbulbifer sp. 2205BS26-8]MDP5210483.1 gamma-glutamyltransferase [Microbulbifer sp. 2205BS26-8]